MGLADKLRNSSNTLNEREIEQLKQIEEKKRAEAEEAECHRKKIEEKAEQAIASIHSLCVPSEKQCEGYIFKNFLWPGSRPVASKRLYAYDYPRTRVVNGHNLYVRVGIEYHLPSVGDTESSGNRHFYAYDENERKYCEELIDSIKLLAKEEGFSFFSASIVPVYYIKTKTKITGGFWTTKNIKNHYYSEVSDRVSGYAIQFLIRW